MLGSTVAGRRVPARSLAMRQAGSPVRRSGESAGESASSNEDGRIFVPANPVVTSPHVEVLNHPREVQGSTRFALLHPQFCREGFQVSTYLKSNNYVPEVQSKIMINVAVVLRIFYDFYIYRIV